MSFIGLKIEYGLDGFWFWFFLMGMGLWNLFQFRLGPKGLIILRAWTLGLLGLNLSKLVHFYFSGLGVVWISDWAYVVEWVWLWDWACASNVGLMCISDLGSKVEKIWLWALVFWFRLNGWAWIWAWCDWEWVEGVWVGCIFNLNGLEALD